MPTLTEPEAEQSSAGIDASIDQLEAYANDPANATGTADSSGGTTPGKVPVPEARSTSDIVSSAALGAAATASKAGGPAGKIFGFVVKNKKWLQGGGIVSIILAILIFGFLALIPLKLESMIKNLTSDALGPIESAMEHRVERVVLRLVLNRAAGGGTIATGSILYDVWANKLVIKVEKDLLDKGVKIEYGSAKGRIKVTTTGGPNPGTFEGTIDEFLNKDLSSNDARSMIRKVAKEQTKWHQFIKRSHIRKVMRQAYGVRKWKWLDKKAGKAATTEIAETSASAATDSYLSRLGKYISCVLGSASDCPGDLANEKNANEGVEAKEDSQGDEAERALREGIEEATEEAGKQTGKQIGQTLSKLIEKKLLVKAIPYVGWVDLAARLDNFVWNNGPSKIIADKNKVQYVSFFAYWATNSSAMHINGVSGDEVNELMKRLDGIEDSKIYQHIYAGSNEKPEISQWSKVSTKNLDSLSNFYRDNPQYWTTHAIGVAWLATLGKIVDVIGDITGWILGFIPYLDTVEKFVGEVIVKALGPLLFPVVTGSEVGAELFDAAYAGANVIANDAAQAWGGVAVDDSTAAAFDHKMALERDAGMRSNDPITRLTSLDDPRSLGSRILAALPASPGGIASGSSNGIFAAAIHPVTGVFRQIGGLFGGWYSPANANTTYNPYDIQNYRFTNAQIYGDINPLILEGKAKTEADCKDPSINPEAKNSKGANSCLFDIKSIEAVKPLFTEEDDGGLGGGTGSGGGASPTACGDAASCAKAILAKPDKITYTTSFAKEDLATVASGNPITTCGLNGPLNVKMLSNILALSDKYSISINNFVSGRGGCDGGQHPKGKAFDVNHVNGKVTSPANADIMRQYALDFFALLPTGGGLGQQQCLGNFGLPGRVEYFYDICNHIHIDVRGN